LEKSLLIFQDLLIHYKSTYGELHHLVGSTLHNIGIVLLRLHQHEAAISSFQQAVRVRRGSIGRDHPDVAVSLVKVGITQLLLKQFEDALFTFREALSVRRHALGHLHPSTARIYNNIGCVHVEFNELKEARRAFESALDVQRNALCYEPDSTQLLFGAATTLCNLGYLYTHRGAHNKTSLVLEEALVLQQRVFDACHPTVLSILDSLADSCGRSGDNANAVTHYKEVIARLEGSNGSVTGDDNGNGNGIDENNHKNLNVHSNNTPIRSKRKRRALAIVKYKLSKVYRNQNDFECALKSLRESFSYVNDESETETPTSDLMQKVKDEIVEVENELKNTDLDWL
jgi:tetratricopeptide (TPR) repeat protein